jgi:hypothetical protein
MNEVVPVFSGSGSLPSHVGERQIGIMSSSFPIAHNCQIKELLLDGFDLRVSHSRSGKPIKKVNQRINRFHSTVSDTHNNMRVCLADLKAIKQRSGAFDYARRLIASGAAISVCHPAAIYRRWRRKTLRRNQP